MILAACSWSGGRQAWSMLKNHSSWIRKKGCAVMLDGGSAFGSLRRGTVLARWRVVVLAGAKNVPPDVATPLTNRGVGHFIAEYHEKNTEYFREPTAKSLEEIVPLDLLWLFRHSGRGEISRFAKSTHYSMNAVTKKSAEGYTKLVSALIDHCFTSGDGTELHYTNILDAADLIPLEQYRIDTLRD
jgi:hypothetical protein